MVASLCLLIAVAQTGARTDPTSRVLPEVGHLQGASYTTEVRPGIKHTRYLLAGPVRVNVLEIDRVWHDRIRVALSRGKVAGTERVRDMAIRTGAIAGINGDLWGPNGVEQGLTMVEGRIVMAPKCRTAFAIRRDVTPVIERFIDAWAWAATVSTHTGATHPLTLINSDLNDGWLNMYTPEYGLNVSSSVVGNSAEAYFNARGIVTQVRLNQLRMAGNQPVFGGGPIGYVLAGRGAAATWIRDNVRVGQRLTFNFPMRLPWQQIEYAISGGPRILLNGQIYEDPITNPWTPPSEEFTPSFKQTYYLTRQPRTAIGISADRAKIWFVTVDGRMSQWSIGMTLNELAAFMRDLGASDAVNMDGGGSSTMVIDGQVVNRPSDNARADGTGGVPRSVANGIFVYPGRLPRTGI